MVAKHPFTVLSGLFSFDYWLNETDKIRGNNININGLMILFMQGTESMGGGLYTKEDFVLFTDWNVNHCSVFDNMLMSKWKSMQELEGYFRYVLNIDNSKLLPGNYRYFAQLNLNRALLRRKPIEMQSMSQAFDSKSFNFTKMDQKEILFEVCNTEKNAKGNYLAINVSPLEFGHCLLLPALDSCLPQIVTLDSLSAAIELFLLSATPSLRMGFNGLCAHASVNHLHYHIYYLQQQMLLETVELQPVAGPCYQLTNFPSRGFAFLLAPGEDVEQFVMSIYRLANFLQENETPHNITVTRGTGFEQKYETSVRDHVRAYVWARKPAYGAKECSAFMPALCELFGHLQIKNEADYEILTEEFVSQAMRDLTEEPFDSVFDKVKQLFQGICENLPADQQNHLDAESKYVLL